MYILYRYNEKRNEYNTKNAHKYFIIFVFEYEIRFFYERTIYTLIIWLKYLFSCYVARHKDGFLPYNKKDFFYFGEKTFLL